MKYISVKDAAEKWSVSIRWVQEMCKRGEIDGAVRWGRAWMIPEDTLYPYGEGFAETLSLPMPKKSPFLDMTDLYSTPGTADECIASLAGQPEAQALFAAEIAYSRGEIEKVYHLSQFFLKAHSGFYAIIGSGMLLSLCAIWRGDFEMWKDAKNHICTAPCKDPGDAEILSLSLAAADSAIYDNTNYPEWFRKGDFSLLREDSYPAATVFYAKNIFSWAYDLAMGRVQLDDVKGLALMRIAPFIIEPLIGQVLREKALIPEIYLRILCAICYHNIGADEKAIPYLDRAISLALPDRLYGILAEHRRHLDYLLDERLSLVDKDALKEVKELHKTISEGFAKLHNILLDRKITSILSAREREVAKLAAFGLSNQEIARRLIISETSVKSALSMAKNKTGAKNRADFGLYL